MDEILRNQIALFRYGIIAPLVTQGETSPQERGDFFRDAAEKEYRHPDGRMVSVSSDTVYRYFRKYSEGGFDALRPVGRSDLGKTRMAFVLLNRKRPVAYSGDCPCFFFC